MEPTNRYALIFETMTELIPEIRAANANISQALPNLSKVLREYTPLPHEAMFLGLAEDGLPVLLNLRDPLPGPVLIAGDKESGKTKLLQIIAQAINEGQDSDTISYAVITDNFKAWDRFDHSKNCEGILSFHQPLTINYLESLMNWAHSNKQEKKFILLLIDGLEALSDDLEMHSIIRWLLFRGPSRRVWPIVTLNAAHIFEVNQWMESFRTRLIGHLSNDQDIQVLTGSSNFPFRDLIPGSQFAMRENKVWLPFWLPNPD